MQAAALLPHWNTFEARALRVVISDLPARFPEAVVQCLTAPAGNGNNPAVLYCQGTVIRHADCSDSRPIAALHITRFRVLPFTPGFNSPQLTREHGEQL